MLKAPQLKSLVLVGHCHIVDKSSACGAKVPGGGKILFQLKKKIFQKSELSFIWVQLGKWSSRQKMVNSAKKCCMQNKIGCGMRNKIGRGMQKNVSPLYYKPRVFNLGLRMTL